MIPELDLVPISLYASLEEAETLELEKALIALNEEIPADGAPIFIEAENLSKLTVDVCGVMLFKNTTLHSNSSSQLESSQAANTSLVFTDTTKRNLHALALALSLGDPVFLEGLTGSGKTRLVEYLAQVTGQKGFFFFLFFFLFFSYSFFIL